MLVSGRIVSLLIQSVQKMLPWELEACLPMLSALATLRWVIMFLKKIFQQLLRLLSDTTPHKVQAITTHKVILSSGTRRVLTLQQELTTTPSSAIRQVLLLPLASPTLLSALRKLLTTSQPVRATSLSATISLRRLLRPLTLLT